MLTVLFMVIAAVCLERSLALTILNYWPRPKDADRFYATYRWIAFPRTLLVAAPAVIAFAGNLLKLDPNLVTLCLVVSLAALAASAVHDGVRAARAAALE